jgi:hypothetical protein
VTYLRCGRSGGLTPLADWRDRQRGARHRGRLLLSPRLACAVGGLGVWPSIVEWFGRTRPKMLDGDVRFVLWSFGCWLSSRRRPTPRLEAASRSLKGRPGTQSGCAPPHAAPALDRRDRAGVRPSSGRTPALRGWPRVSGRLEAAAAHAWERQLNAPGQQLTPGSDNSRGPVRDRAVARRRAAPRRSPGRSRAAVQGA